MKSFGIGARVQHPSFGIGIITEVNVSTFNVFFKSEGDKEISRAFQGLELLSPAPEGPKGISLEDVEKAITNVIEAKSDITHVVELADKWKGGKMSLQPLDSALQAKDIPVETFFHKIVMVRDRLRVLEQNINSHKGLSDEEKVHLQQYITRTYGSLTTFNVLFKYKDDHFRGDGGK